ncbi:VOC family protein [Pseudomonas sp. NY11955]|uniref:VOC family protein n=1 Tax=Pseudomonas sp. NY11955 TaxID=3400363 RepID=UPI003A87B54B
MKIKFSHANLVSEDWLRLSSFYMNVFGCVIKGPVRRLFGAELSKGIGVSNPIIEGVHLKLPGCDCGPTLEIFQYHKNLVEDIKHSNSTGITHLAFEVSNLEAVCLDVIRCGGSMLGKLSRIPVEGVGVCAFIYARDPDGNIIEIQSWGANEESIGAI